MYLSEKNTSAALEQLHKCVDDVKAWMSTSKLKANHYRTEFIIFGLKSQKEKFKACF